MRIIMKFLLPICIFLTTFSTFAVGDDCKAVKAQEVASTGKTLFDEVSYFLGYEQVDWTDRDSFQGEKVILKLHTKAKETTSAPNGKNEYETRYVIGSVDLAISLGESGIERSYLKFVPVSEIEAKRLNKDDGIRIIKKVVNYAQFTLERDLPLGEEIYASFEPVRSKIVVGMPLTDKTQFELSGESAIGYAYASSTHAEYDDISNFYVGLAAGFKLRHRDLGTIGFDYGVDSGVVIQNERPGSPIGLTRKGDVKLYYEFKIAQNTECNIYAQKRSFQMKPGYDEESETMQDRMYNKAKYYGLGCTGRF